MLTVLYFQPCAVRNQQRNFFTRFVILNNGVPGIFYLLDRNRTGSFRQDGNHFRPPHLKQFLNTRKTLCNIRTGSNTTGMERSHRQLRTGLTDRLRSNDTDRFTDIDRIAGCQVFAVTSGADAVFTVTTQNRTYMNLFDAGFYNRRSLFFRNRFRGIPRNQYFAGLGMNNIVNRETALQPLCQPFDLFITFLDIIDPYTGMSSAVIFTNNNILRNIDQTPRQITGVCRSQRRIRLTFTSTSGRNKVFQHIQSLTEVSTNRNVDRTTRCIRHQSTHTAKLTDLVNTSAGTGSCHHLNRILFTQTILQFSGHFFGGVIPNLNHLIISFRIGNQTTFKVFSYFFNFLFGFVQNFCFFRRDNHIRNRNRNRASCRIFIPLRFNFIQNIRRLRNAMYADTFVNNLSKRFLRYNKVHFIVKRMFRIRPVNKAQILRNRRVKDDAANRGYNHFLNGFPVNLLCYTHFDRGMHADYAGIISHQRLVRIFKDLTGLQHFAVFIKLPSALFIVAYNRQIVRTQNHILSRNRNRFSVLRTQQVIGRKHQESCLSLRLCRKRNVNSHLVSVEVRIKCRTNQRMQFQRASFYQNRLKRLDTQPMQGRSTVQHNRIFLNDGFQRIPYTRICRFNRFLCTLDILSLAQIGQPLHDKRLKQFQSHFFRQSALIQLQFRTDHDNATTGIVNTFTQQVLSESTLFTF